jgi:hypothetical protein
VAEVQDHLEAGVVAPLEGEDLAVDLPRRVAADAERAALPAQRDQPPIQRQDGARVLGERLDVAAAVLWIER